MIDSKDISVVIQGPINLDFTGKVISCIKKLLPESQIIISTWTDASFENIDTTGCVVLKNEDPNPNGKTYFADLRKSVPNNTNRQIVSSFAGIRKATRKYVLRLRSDIELKTLDFLNYWDLFDQRDENYSLFKHKIIIPSIVSMNPKPNSGYFQTQISDWMQFGMKEDMVQLYDIPLLSENDMNFYINNDFKLPNGFIDRDAHCVWRWGSEQYIFISGVFKKLDINYPHRKAITKEIIKELNQFFVNNFIVLDPSDWQFDNVKYPIKYIYIAWGNQYDKYRTLYNSNKYRLDYKKQNKGVKIKLNNFDFDVIKSIIKQHLSRHNCISIFKILLRILKVTKYD